MLERVRERKAMAGTRLTPEEILARGGSLFYLRFAVGSLRSSALREDGTAAGADEVPVDPLDEVPVSARLPGCGTRVGNHPGLPGSRFASGGAEVPVDPRGGRRYSSKNLEMDRTPL